MTCSRTFPCYLVDAFTDSAFAGNQAAVCLIPTELPDATYQKIAAEFNFSDTAYPVPLNGDFKTASKFNLRWFTPKVEVPFCGHATLATSHVLFYEIANENSTITFSTKNGDLIIRRALGDKIEMDFPQYEVTSCQMGGLWDPKSANLFPKFGAPHYLKDLIGQLVPSSINVEDVAYAAKAKNLIVVIDKKTTKFEMLQLNENIKNLVNIHPEGDFVRGIIICLAPDDAYVQDFMDGEQRTYDYVCRYFAPWVGVDEDAATGSAQCALAPYFSKILEKSSLYAFQNYPGRGAQFFIEMADDGRLKIIGKAVSIVRGNIFLDKDVKLF